MSQIGTSTSNANSALNMDSNTRNSVFFTDDDLNYYVIFYISGANIYYSFTTDNGKTWSDPILLASDSTSERIGICIDSSNNIHLINRTISGSNYNIRYIKLTYSGDGVWTHGSWKSAYTSNYASKFDIIVDSNGRIWIALDQYNQSTLTWLDTVAFYSDNNGDSWSSLTTIKVSGGTVNIGLAPTFGLRNGKPVLVYINGTVTDIALKEWSGSAWGSEKTTSQAAPGGASGGVARSISVLTIGTVNYIVFTIAYYSHNDGANQFNEDCYIVTWDGTDFGTAIKILSRQTFLYQRQYNLSASYNGSEILVAYLSRLNRAGVFSVKFVTHNLTTGKTSNQIIVDSNDGNDQVTISKPQLPIIYSGYPLIIYSFYRDGGTKILSRYFSRDYGIKIAKAGQDVKELLTEANKKNFIIMNTVDAHKIVFADFVSATSYNHGLDFAPFCDAFAVDSVSSPTYFEKIDVEVTSTQITGLNNPSYLIIYSEEL